MAAGADMSDNEPARRVSVVLGEDWVGPDGSVDKEIRQGRERRRVISLNRSPLARKIITFNLLAMIFLVAGVLFLNPFRDSLVYQREVGMIAEAELVANVFEARLEAVSGASVSDMRETLSSLDLRRGVDVYLYDTFARP